MYKLAEFRRKLKGKNQTTVINKKHDIESLKMKITLSKEEREDSIRCLVIGGLVQRLVFYSAVDGYKDIKETIKTKRDAEIFKTLTR